ncbi:hypothetical protein MPER_11189, partial [Moniliophthora perniciosa FA553]
EKAYVLSRGFVRRSLEIPLGGLEKEIEWMYYTNGRLEKVLRDSRTLIGKSRTQEDTEDQDLAVPRLTAGGIIALERTLRLLEGCIGSFMPAPVNSAKGMSVVPGQLLTKMPTNGYLLCTLT